MTQFYIPMESTDQWRRLLAEPDKHWKKGRSAMSLALSWTSAKGFPNAVRDAIRKADSAAVHPAEFAIGFPEHKVELPGGSRASQTDLLVLARTPRGSMVIAVEGKVDETFGPLVREWKADASAGKQERLAFLCAKLGLKTEAIDDCRYQLLHRTASAVIEAKRFNAQDALMLVHSFDANEAGFDDYARFLSCFDVRAEVGRSQRARVVAGVDLHFCWTSDLL